MGMTWNKIMSASLAAAGFAAIGLAGPPAMAEGPITVRDFVLSHGIEGREPVGAAGPFRVEDGRAYAFARIRNSGAPTTVKFVWHYDGKPHAEIAMNIGQSPGWRTWSSARLRPGSWRVELVDSSGAVLKEAAFNVGPKGAGPVAAQGMPMTPDAGGMGNR